MENTLPQVVDLQTSSMDIAYALSYLTEKFINAADQLILACAALSNSEFHHHSKKIVALIEISSRTLIHEGILPYTFASCPALLLPFKAAHLALLEMLRYHRHKVSVDLYGRTRRLLVPLSSQFIIRKKGDATPLDIMNRPPPAHHRSLSPRGEQSPRYPRLNVDFTANHSPGRTSSLMPPPPSNPVRCQRSDDPRVRRSLYRRKPVSLLVARVSRSRSRSPRTFQNPKQAQENIAPSAFIQRPMRRHFGIFCGAKKSVVRQEQRESRSRTSRPVPKE